MELPPEPTGGSGTLHSGAATSLENVMAMRQAWRALAADSDLPTTQFEWAVAALNQLGPASRAYVAYVNDGSTVRAILPLMTKSRMGVEHFQFMTPAIPIPVDIPHSGRDAFAALIASVTRLGRPIHLSGMLGDSPVSDMLREMAHDRRGRVLIDDAPPASYLATSGVSLQDRIQIAARISIIATSYGLSGGPNDVIFQFVAPALDQVMHLFHESLQLNTAPSGASGTRRSRSRKDLDTIEFMRSYAFNSGERGEIRFSCLRLAGRLLAVQMLQVRRKTAWLLSAGHLDRFRDTTLASLLMGETIRSLRHEGVERLMLPPGPGIAEVGSIQQVPCIDVTIYPWSSRSLLAKVMGRAGRVSGLLRRPRREGRAGK